MMGLRTIRQLADEQARKASRSKKKPYRPYDEAEVAEYGSKQMPFPNIGSYQPPGWKMVDSYFCNKTSWGTASKPIRTLGALKATLVENIRAGKDYGYAIVTECEFQVVLGVFEELVPKKRTKK